MIDVKLIKKPRNEGSATGISTGGTTYGGMAVKEAAHAAKADIAEQSKEAVHSKEADHAKEADKSGKATSAEYADEAGHSKEADHAKEADNADKWDSRHFDDYLDQPVRKTDPVEFDSVVTDTVRSAGTFVDGLLGEGFKLWRDKEGKTHLCLDCLTVRQTMVVLELLIEKIRSVGGQICVSAANGKIKEVKDNGDSYRIIFEQDNGFVANDLMRCATWKDGTMYGYWVEIDRADKEGVDVLKAEFAGIGPEVGDECVLMGNTSNRKRQNLILISATEDGQPRMDVLDGVSSKTFAKCLRARLGNLDGINDSWFPADNQPHGNGLYSDNAYLRGTFLLVTGEDIKTKFEITEGKIESAVEGLRQDFAGDKGYLSNSTFADGMAKWNTSNEAVFFLAGNRWIWANKNVLTKKGSCASVTKDNGRTVVLIRDKHIIQKNANLRTIPHFATNAKGEKEALPVYLSFFYRCARPGTLKVEFENVDKTGFADFNSMQVEERLEATDGYKQYSCDGLWNGTGDFKLSFTGEIYLYMLILSTDKVESLAHKYKTLFEQSDRLVKISAAIYDKDENALRETGLLVRPDGSGIYMQTADGKLALIGVAVEQTDAAGNTKTVIKLTADNIKLEGLVTANGNFKILEDGSMEAANGKFTGEINASRGRIAGFEISGNSLTNSGDNNSFDNDATIIFRNDYHKCFAGIGGNVLPSSSGHRAVARFENEDTEDWWGLGENYAMIVSARGANKNVAIDVFGGSIAGLAYKTQMIGWGKRTSEKKPTEYSEFISRATGVLYINTRLDWRSKEKDANGKDVEFTVTSWDVNAIMPDMYDHDDGHTIKVKRGMSSGNTVYLIPGKSFYTTLESDGTMFGYNRVTHESKSCFLVDRGSYVTDKLPVSSEMDSAEYIYFRDIVVTINKTDYHGVWVQFKHPRDW